MICFKNIVKGNHKVSSYPSDPGYSIVMKCKNRFYNIRLGIDNYMNIQFIVQIFFSSNRERKNKKSVFQKHDRIEMFIFGLCIFAC